MEEIDIREIVSMFWKKKSYIILILVMFVILGCIYTIKFTKPLYTSKTTLLLVSSNDNKENSIITASDITINTKLVSTYSELIKSKNVLEKVISNLDIQIDEEELRKSIEVKSVKNTQLIEISVQNEVPEYSAQIANELTKVFETQVKEMYNINNIQIMNQADVQTQPSNINHKKDIIVFAMAGIVVGAGCVFISDMLNRTIKTVDGIEKEFGLPALTTIPIYENRLKKGELIVHEEPKSPISETFRTLRTNIQFIKGKEKLQTILITSTLPKEGKSFVSANLAITFAQSGKKVIVIDADMRKGRQASIFRVLRKPGLSNYLLDVSEETQIKLEEYIQETKIEGLNVISEGNIPPNPSELLVSEAMINLLEKLKEIYDIIILDGPPTQLVTDSLILTRLVDSTVIVSASNETKKDNLHKIIDSIHNVEGKISGIVLNKVVVSAKEYKSKYYYREENEK